MLKAFNGDEGKGFLPLCSIANFQGGKEGRSIYRENGDLQSSDGTEQGIMGVVTHCYLFATF